MAYIHTYIWQGAPEASSNSQSAWHTAPRAHDNNTIQNPAHTQEADWFTIPHRSVPNRPVHHAVAVATNQTAAAAQKFVCTDWGFDYAGSLVVEQRDGTCTYVIDGSEADVSAEQLRDVFAGLYQQIVVKQKARNVSVDMYPCAQAYMHTYICTYIDTLLR
jgi:hypothetical protein